MITERQIQKLNAHLKPRLRRTFGLPSEPLPVIAEFRTSLSLSRSVFGSPEQYGRSIFWNFAGPNNETYTARALETGRDDVTLRICAKDDGIGFYLFVADALASA